LVSLCGDGSHLKLLHDVHVGCAKASGIGTFLTSLYANRASRPRLLRKRNRVAKFKEHEMTMNEGGKITADEIRDLLGKPPLIKGENAEDYWRWWNAFVEEHQPECLSDWVSVDELAAKHWEQNRGRRSNAALLEGALFEALKNLVSPFCNRQLYDGIPPIPSQISYAYYLSDNKDRQKARKQVEEWGITDDHILAEAMQIRAKAIILMDRIDHHRANSKRSTMKDLIRNSQLRSKQPDQPQSLQ
jgi:hypothetical protein